MEEHKFVHLHLHTEYSLLDGATRITSLVEKCMSLGMTSVAITDHGNMYGAVTLYDECNNQYDDYLKKCKKKGIEPTLKKVKPIIGCEFYLCEDISVKTGKGKFAHLILLAKNEQGYKNLSLLNAIAYRDGFYYKPRIDYKILAEHSAGLICLSACIAGDIPQLLLDNRYEDAKEFALMLKNMFEDGDFYIEVQDHGLTEEKFVLPLLFKLADDIGVKTVATNDVHYLNKEDAESQDVLMCIQMRKTIDDPTRLKMDTDQLYLKTYDEMLELFSSHPECLDTTIEIANKCNYEFTYGVYKYPKYEPVTGEEPLVYLRKLIDEGIHRKYKEITQVLLDRIEYELGIITRLGFVEYYLIVWDYINAARRMGISVGPGRGSGAGSVVAYAIGITDIDPLKYELYFERFLNPERVSAPDFDVDFEDCRREEVINYVSQKYGQDRVIRIITMGTMAAKNAIKDVGRVLNVPFAELNNLTKLIPGTVKRPYIIKQVLGKRKPIVDDEEVDNSVPELIELYNNNETMRKILDIAIVLEDMPRQSSTHPCGVIIGKDALDKFDPLSRNKDTLTTQYPGAQMEHLGHLKMDFLGLANLTDIKLCIGYVEENYGVKIDFSELGYEDQEVYKLMSTGNTKAIFQIESPGFQKFLRELKPTCIEDIVAGVSLYRPGPMDSIPDFVHNKHHPEDITYDAPCLEPILNYTYGCIVYQEQVMKIVQEMAGYSLGQADNVRRMMGKKQVDKMAKEEEVFLYGKPAENGKPAIDGAIKRGINEDIAKKVWAKMANFAKYAFNKSHAAAYSLLTYQTGYLKCYYEAEFLTAVLNNRISKPDDLKRYILHAKEENIKILPPDINKSDVYFTVKNKEIRFGLSALKHLGIQIVKNIVDERKENGDYLDINDFCVRVFKFGINKRMIESLIYCGAMDCFGKKRSQLIAVYEGIMDRIASQKKKEAYGQISMFDIMFQDVALVDEVVYPNLPEFNNQELLKHEKEIAGIYISGHPLDKYMDKIMSFNFNSTMISNEKEELSDDDIEEATFEQDEENFSENSIKDGDKVEFGAIITDVKRILTKSNTEMCALNCEDLYGAIDVVMFSRTFEKYKSKLEIDKIGTFRGRVSIKDNGQTSIICEEIEFWEPEQAQQIPQEVLLNKDTKLGLIYNTQDNSLSRKIEEIISFYPGETQVFVRCSKTNLRYKLRVTCKLCEALLNELYGYLNKDNVRFF